MVQLGLMTSWVDRYNIKIILVKWDYGSNDQNQDEYSQREITLLLSL